MSKKKVGRNDPCICGSRKKYRHCCGKSRVVNSNGINPNFELDVLHHQLQTFAFENYGDKIKEQSQLFEHPSIKGNSELVDIYFTGLTLWIITKLKFLENKQTILELFYHIVVAKLSPNVKQLFSRWMKSNPSIYEVISVPEGSEEGFVELRDLLTNRRYSIPFRVGDEYIKGSFVVGALVPFAGFYSFLLTIIKLYGHNNIGIHELVNRFSKKKGGLSAQFPKFLAEALLLGVHNEENNPLYEQVAQTFADHMVENGVDDAVILQGLDLWKKFCEKEKPSFKKAEPYAAALEYYVQKNLLGNDEVTQSTVAKEYDASVSSMSTNYRKLTNMIETETVE